jgi:hypothetical protein
MNCMSLVLSTSPFILTAAAVSGKFCDKIDIVSRAEWGARQPRNPPTVRTLPVNMTFIHHSEGPGSTNSSECINIVRSIQDYHMDERGWALAYELRICNTCLQN